MRIVKDFPHPHYKVTLMHYQDRYSVRVNDGPLSLDIRVAEEIPQNPEAIERWFRESIAEALKMPLEHLHRLRIPGRGTEEEDFPDLI